MTVTPELEAQILRLYHVEKWRCGTIAKQLHVHHTTVHRVLTQAGLPRNRPILRPTKIEPYLPIVLKTLEQFPALTASRLYAMMRERGYRGSPSYFRHLIALHRPRKPAEAFLRLRTLPSEQGQVDWGHFGHIEIGRARRPLMAFVMVLSYSRDIYLRFFLDARVENFLRGHIGAFNTWCGLPRVLLYDNLKSAVLERQGDAIRFHRTLLAFAGHYRFEPRPVAVARGNEKGRVERATYPGGILHRPQVHRSRRPECPGRTMVPIRSGGPTMSGGSRDDSRRSQRSNHCFYRCPPTRIPLRSRSP
ncbi:IS21 family transposase [Bradyrhizobium sp. 160]|uniref:IS21 family transposase n=1 Tax=Bradyrhizobium sp. 160 TaxID=2782634 RepID=UPI001FF7C19F|nr:IS21 family transposase [Bradyrhizobium sp. 160]